MIASLITSYKDKILQYGCQLLYVFTSWDVHGSLSSVDDAINAASTHTWPTDSLQGGLASSCIPQTFPFPHIFGAEELAVNTKVIRNYTLPPEDLWPGETQPDFPPASFCNVSISYTHPGQEDVINAEFWLPLEGWNGRFQGAGGGGYVTGMDKFIMFTAVSSGFAVGTTDGGHPHYISGDPYQWALVSPGNVNLYLLQDFASVSLNETAWIGKAVAASFYGSPPKYSYWDGCSTGGRQGLMLAQRYPTAYDGIVATAPAINWPTFIPAALYIRTITSTLGVEPSACEYDILTEAAVSSCDGKDGVLDNIISAPHLCDFDPFTLVGRKIWCEAEKDYVEISEAAALVARTTWDGPKKSDGSFLWYGMAPDAPITGNLGYAKPPAENKCTGVGCMSDSWAKLWVYKNADINLTMLSQPGYESIVRRSTQEYNSIIGTNDPDLTEFRNNGGKMVTWHGLADASIPAGGTEDYYKRVLAHDPSAPDYYRFFEAPGVGHCFRGNGPFPKTVFDKLVAWVERGEVPEILPAESPPDQEGLTYKRPLCPYPAVARYKGTGDPRSAENFECGKKL